MKEVLIMNTWNCQYLITALLVLMIYACSTTQQVRQELQKNWEGRNVNDLITELGPPTQVLDDGQGGKILVYTSTKHIHSSGDSFTSYQGASQTYYAGGRTAYSTDSGTANTFTTPGLSYKRSRHQMFWVNDRGIIYRVGYQKTKGR
jgi:hypothetical protein